MPLAATAHNIARQGSPATTTQNIAHQGRLSRLTIAAREIAKQGRIAADVDMKEWQRVNSYIADVLKDAHVLYAKLARLQSDFAGEELDRLLQISENVLVTGETLSKFSRDFYEGRLEMAKTEFTYSGKSTPSAPLPETEEIFQPFGGAAPTKEAEADEADEADEAEADEETEIPEQQ